MISEEQKKEQRAQVLAWLAQQGVPYTLVEHPPAYTMEDIVTYGIDRHGHVCKNLFLRDSKKGKRHFLLVVSGEQKVDLQRAGQALGERLSFASQERLEKYLCLQKGEVTPLGVLFDEDKAVEVFFDAALPEKGMVGVHPCDNTATVFLPFEALRRLVEEHGNACKMVEL